ncbi:hypothetical protein SASPL_112174 [Salvia splendens]|uniref:Uncharacterized protein n=1 Tax=Salvia splendens TaxID=180675 RepID=A0A8X8YC57_SALSN|nr:hypothetical protein SASPL_112174 [Salvia splendens]
MVKCNYSLQLAFAKDVMSAIEGFGNYRYAVLTPNLKAAMAAGEKEVAVFAAVYISCVVGCPMEGVVPPSKVAYVAEELINMVGCAEISLGTAILMLEIVLDVVLIEKLAVHSHDTYGQALSDILLSLKVQVYTQVEWCLHLEFTTAFGTDRIGPSQSIDCPRLYRSEHQQLAVSQV